MVARTKPTKLSDRAIFRIAAEYERAAQSVKKFSKSKAEAQTKLITELHDRRGIKSLTDADTGLTVTVSQASSVVYDDEGLWGELTPKERRVAFDEEVNLNLLSPNKKREILATLTRAEKRKVISHQLNIERLAVAVQDGKIPVEKVAPHSEVKKNAPYVNVTRKEAG